VRVVIADDESLLREGLTRLLTESGFEVVGVAGDADVLLRLVEARRPDLTVVDIKMPPEHREEGLVATPGDPSALPDDRGAGCSRTTSSRATRCRSPRPARALRLPAQEPACRTSACSPTRCGDIKAEAT